MAARKSTSGLVEPDAIAEIEANGFSLVSKKDFVPQVQWLGIFTPAKSFAPANLGISVK